MSAPATRPRILFATNVERGQCGVFLATVNALLRSRPEADLHLASFPSLEKEVRSISDEAVRVKAGTKPVAFHAIQGQTHAEAVVARNAEKYGEGSAVPPPAFSRPLDASTTMATIRDLCSYLLGWDGPGFMQVYESVSGIIQAVQPDLIIVDVLLSPAISAAWNSGVKFSYLSPNAIKDFAASYQPLAMMWKWPALMSGYDYPVPWYQKPMNVYHYLYMVYQILKEPGLAETKRYVEEKTGKPMRCLMNTGKSLPDDVKIFVGTLPELDFPLKSHPRIEDRAVELAKGLNMAIGQIEGKTHLGPPLQVLWKLKKDGEYDATGTASKVRAAFGGKMDDDRIRIVDWLDSSPLAVLKSGNVVCAVHHGGASSYNEAILAGIPHVVLPFWTDCYEYANRVEMLGIGRKGTRKRQPVFEATEFSEVLLEVIDGKNSESMGENARALAELCKKNGNGPDIAARGILKLAAEAATDASKETTA
ncbi:hypothetical protein LLEC1_06970 [Akanthomyces lecanii]|uniref:Erythromycin biosynthesis protein CIII-like C-terminal domain-containing protein n=1 Tax=Cordyceps confragosa TaxID=2714763 RepID=A0A179I2A7_CORDF|nr:hypothetical protein LLEC1_06970 [Akanthomyces lecanii]